MKLNYLFFCLCVCSSILHNETSNWIFFLNVFSLSQHSDVSYLYPEKKLLIPTANCIIIFRKITWFFLITIRAKSRVTANEIVLRTLFSNKFKPKLNIRDDKLGPSSFDLIDEPVLSRRSLQFEFQCKNKHYSNGALMVDKKEFTLRY